MVDGESFTFLLSGKQQNKDRPLFWHYPNEWGPEGPGIGSYSAVRQGDWKLIYFHTNRRFELYNLKNDIQEKDNLFHSNSEKAQDLAATLTTHLKQVNAQMPSDKLTGEVVPWPSTLLSPKK